MTCTHCGSRIAYNVYTGRYFITERSDQFTINSPCMTLPHTPAN